MAKHKKRPPAHVPHDLRMYFLNKVLPAVRAFHDVPAEEVLAVTTWNSQRTRKCTPHFRYKKPLHVAARRDCVRILRGTVKRGRSGVWCISRHGFVATEHCPSWEIEFSYVISYPVIAALIHSPTHTTPLLMVKMMEKLGEPTAVTLDGYPGNVAQYALKGGVVNASRATSERDGGETDVRGGDSVRGRAAGSKRPDTGQSERPAGITCGPGGESGC